MTTPALPAGFQLVPSQYDHPPLPPGFQLQSQHHDFSNVQHHADTVTDTSRVPIYGMRQDQMSQLDRFGAGAASAIASPIVGLAQMLDLGTPEWRNATMQRIDAARSTPAGKVGNLASEAAMWAVPASKIAKLPKLARFVASTAGGAGIGALQGAHEGESRGMNAAVGGAAGLAGETGASVLSAAGRRSAAAIPGIKREMAAVAQKYGIPLHVTQITDSLPAKVAASASKYLPFSGAGAAARRQQTALDDAASQIMGNAPGIERPLSDAGMRATANRIGAVYDDIYGRHNVSLAPDAVRNLSTVFNRAAANLTDEQGAFVSKQLDRILNNFGSGTIPGKKYQFLRGELRKAAKSAPGPAGDAIRQLAGEVDNAVAGSIGGQDAAALAQANRQWANYRTIKDALKQAKGAGESVSAANLWNLVRNGSTPEMRELARLGKTLLADPIPDSGTAGRNIFYSALGTGAAATPFTGGGSLVPALTQLGLGATVGRAANSSTLAQIMLRDGRGQLQQGLAPYVRGAGLTIPYTYTDSP